MVDLEARVAKLEQQVKDTVELVVRLIIELETYKEERSGEGHDTTGS